MTALLTESEMALWCQTTTEALAADPLAAEVNSKLGDYIRFMAKQPNWTVDTVPVDVKMLAIRVVRRTYTNPDSEVSSSVGPLSSRILDEAALAAAFTESEVALLEGYRPEGGSETLWVASIGGKIPGLPDTIYVGDNQQINLGDEREWMIPYLDINDVGVQDEDFA